MRPGSLTLPSDIEDFLGGVTHYFGDIPGVCIKKTAKLKILARHIAEKECVFWLRYDASRQLYLMCSVIDCEGLLQIPICGSEPLCRHDECIVIV